MVKLSSLISHPWTRLEIVAWILAFIAVITLGTLAVTDVLGPWALILASVIGGAVGLMRYRREMRASR